ncbi:MAG: hypothetical protein ACYDAG_00585 [Chloroflexota bacterium]
MPSRGRRRCPLPSRVLGFAAAALLLASCAPSIPAQPSSPTPAPASSQHPSASGTGGGEMATVAGTGRFGLSIRQAPGLDANRVATVPDGFRAAVVGGPVALDGFDWYELRTPEVTGWASGAYLTLTSAPSSALPLATPLTGLLGQLPGATNYTVGGSRIYVQAALKPAVDHLSASPTAEALLREAAPAYLRITVGHFATASEGGEFATLGHSIKIADAIMKESLDVQSTVLSHELQHAVDVLVRHNAPDTPGQCINLELRAFRTQEKVWLELTKPSPAKTPMEHDLDQLSHVVNTPAFASRLSTLYAHECGSIGRRG